MMNNIDGQNKDDKGTFSIDTEPEELEDIN